MKTKGKVLACEWIYNESSNESDSFVVGYSEGHLEIYKVVDSLKI